MLYQMNDPLLSYACRRVTELEALLLGDVPETLRPGEVGHVLSQLENNGMEIKDHFRHNSTLGRLNREFKL